MKKILLTGGTGFVGSNIQATLKEKYEVHAPNRRELDLHDTDAVENYVRKGNFDVIIHSANPNPVKNELDLLGKMFEDSIRIFMNFYRVREFCGRIYHLGSGAEFDKRYDITNVKETQMGRSIPIDIYGFSKYIMNELTAKSDNVHNMRIFACYGPGDHPTKFITHAINSCMQNKNITIRQDCYFDYMHVRDLAKIMCHFIENMPRHNDYNICSGERLLLSEIAAEVIHQFGIGNSIDILNSGLNKEYTADNTRLLNEIPEFKFTTIKEGINMQIEWEKEFRK